MDKPVAYILPSDRPWIVTLKARFHKTVNQKIRDLPGCKFDKERKLWYVPTELIERIVPIVQDAGFRTDVRWQPKLGQVSFSFGGDHPAQKMHDWQKFHAAKAATTDGTDRWIEGSEMGLGKSPIVLAAVQMRGLSKGIVVDMASHRRDWWNPKYADNEFDKWWPDHPQVELIEDGVAAKESHAAIRVVSYQLLHKLNLDLPVEFLLIDESHMLQNPKTLWSQAVRKLLEKQPHLFVLAMTGTPIPDDVMTGFNLLDTLWPGRLGTKFDFGKRYAHSETNDYGKLEFAGANDENAHELRARFAYFSARTTKPEVAHLLPPFGNPKLLWVPDGERDAAIVEWAQGKLANGAHHLTVLTHFRATAARLSEKLMPEGIPIALLTGEMQAGARSEKIRWLKGQSRGIIVATLHSVATGLDLTFAPVVAFAEIYPRVVEMVQVLGRFHRMTSRETSDITILAKQGGDPQAESLLNKIKAVNLILKPGAVEGGLSSALDELKSLGLTAAQVDDMLRSNVAVMTFDEF